MDRRLFLASLAAAGGSLMLRRSLFGQATRPSSSSTSSPSSDAQSATIRAAATRFLETLSPEHRRQTLLPFPAGATPVPIGFSKLPGGLGRQGGRGGPGPQSRPNDRGPTTGPNGPRRGGPMAAGEKFGDAVWTNFPVGIVERPGVRLGQFAPAELLAAHAFLRSVLSPMGYQKILDIMDADQKVADDGTDYEAGVAVYTLALLGEPNSTAPWMLQFGGHHLGLNVIFVGDRAVCAPLHTGILPSKFEKAGRTIRGLGRENDKAFDLLATFTPEQFKAATIDHDVSDLLMGPGRPDAKVAPAGVLGADMTDTQQAMLLALASEWVGVLNDAHSAERMNAVGESLAQTRFAWSGPTTHEPDMNGEAYFRIHGPSLLIEHAPQGNQGGFKWHVHTIMRDLSNDYGRAWTHSS